MVKYKSKELKVSENLGAFMVLYAKTVDGFSTT
jgi:hypothetical protein